jgi:hypothetical protein
MKGDQLLLFLNVIQQNAYIIKQFPMNYIIFNTIIITNFTIYMWFWDYF